MHKNRELLKKTRIKRESEGEKQLRVKSSHFLSLKTTNIISLSPLYFLFPTLRSFSCVTNSLLNLKESENLYSFPSLSPSLSLYLSLSLSLVIFSCLKNNSFANDFIVVVGCGHKTENVLFFEFNLKIVACIFSDVFRGGEN